MVSRLGHLMGSLAVRALGQVSRALNRAGWGGVAVAGPPCGGSPGEPTPSAP